MYRHAWNLEEALDPQRRLLSAYDTEKGGSKDKLPRVNESLLVTINCSGRVVSTERFVGRMAMKFFNDLYDSFLFRRGFDLFRYGMVRVLVWMRQDATHPPFLPRTAYARSKQMIMLEGFADITEVAGLPSAPVSTLFGRWPALEQEDYTAINTRLKGSPNLAIPESRLEGPPLQELRAVFPSPQNLREMPYFSDAAWVSQFLQDDAALKRKDPKFIREYMRKKPGVRFKNFKTPLHKEWAENFRQGKTRHQTHLKAVELVNESRQLLADWKSAVVEANGRPLDPSLERQLRERGDENHQKIQAQSYDNRLWAEKAIDDCRAKDLSPPVLQWSRRETHPLIVQPGEFQPSYEPMVLLDVVPRTAEVLTKLDTMDKKLCYQHIVAAFTWQLSKSVFELLKRLVSEDGVEAFAKTIPSVYDPTKGGWYDLSQLRIRSLPAEMFVDIAVAFEKWPFRPSIKSMLMLEGEVGSLFTDQDTRLN